MKKQKKDKRRQSTQQLMGIKKITDYCITTDAGDLVFISSSPQTSASSRLVRSARRSVRSRTHSARRRAWSCWQ